MSDVQPFGVKASEAIAYLKGKLPEASVAWDDLAGPVHAKVFTVAGATTTAIASELHQAMVSAIENGTTISEFRKQFDKTVASHGWTYNGKRGWRTQVIFDANMRSAHMAGRWTQIQANKDRRPYLQYRTAGDAQVRPEHRAWNGVIRAVDDAFWSTHYPPNGWGCRCTVRSYSKAEIQLKGLQVTDETFVPQTRVVTKGGEPTDVVPVGIDAGWDHNVGQSWIAPELSLGAKLAKLPPDLRGKVIDKTISPAFQKAIEGNWKRFQATVKASGKPQANAQILGFLDSTTMQAMSELAATVPEADLKSGAIVAFDNRTTHLSGRHKAAVNPAQVWSQDQMDELPSLLRSYKAVLWDKESKALVYVLPIDRPGPSARAQKVVVRPNVKTKYGWALSIVSLGSAARSDLLDVNRYRSLVGTLQ